MEHRRTVKVRLLEAYSRRRSGGKVLEPGLAALHQPQVLRAMVSNEQHHHQGVADNKLREINVWSTSPVYSRPNGW